MRGSNSTKIALGNVALDLPTSLIQGSQTLFGAKHS